MVGKHLSQDTLVKHDVTIYQQYIITINAF